MIIQLCSNICNNSTPAIHNPGAAEGVIDNGD